MIPFGKYLLLERIAIGGMAEVYMAKSFGIEGFEKLLAIKRILPTMAEDEDFIEMFVDEAKISGQLNHANIAPIYELGKIGESHYIAMEYVWGKDLLQMMNRFRRLRKKMPPAMVAWIGAKMCEALDYAHNKRDRRGQSLNIIHRDVSPQNVLVSYEGEVKVIDFGIAKAASRTTKTQAGVLKGKFGYMSPEQVRGLPIDPRSDIFAVGTCMYEMLTSERLFMGQSDFSTLEKVRNADVAPIHQVVRDIPPQLADIVMRTLSREPSDRPDGGADLQEQLMQFLATQRPPFGTSKLGAWMKTAFATEMAREKARLDGFASIGRPSVLGGPRRPAAPAGAPAAPAASARPVPAPPPRAPMPPRQAGPAPTDTPLVTSDLDLLEDDDMQGEATMMSPSPFDDEAMEMEDLDAMVEDELNEQPTQIFFSAEEAEAELGPIYPTAGPGDAAPAHANAAQPGQPGQPGQPAPIPTFKPGSSHPAGPMPSPAPGFAPPPGMAPVGTPSGVQIDASLAAPMQRNLHTVELHASQVPAAPPRAQASNGKMAVLFGLAALLMLGVGVGATYVFLGGDPVGTVELRTVPPVAAMITIDGLARGNSPLRIDNIPAGDHVIEIEAVGFEPTERRIHVTEGATAMLEIALQRQDSTASEPVAVANIAPDETAVAAAAAAAAAAADPEAATAAEAEAAAAAEAEAEAAAAAETAEAEAEAEAAAEAERAAAREAASATMERRVVRERDPEPEEPRVRMVRTPVMRAAMAAAGGTLVINSLPWTRVFIDGRDTGRNTPVRSMPAAAGTRRIGLRTPDGEMHNFTITVEPGEEVRISKRL